VFACESAATIGVGAGEAVRCVRLVVNFTDAGSGSKERRHYTHRATALIGPTDPVAAGFAHSQATVI
jgi:hypothetical protein